MTTRKHLTCASAAALLLSLFAILLTAGCGGSGAGALSGSGTSGVSGVASIVSQGGPVLEGSPPPTPRPYSGGTLAVLPEGSESILAQTKTNALGAFSINLAPGAYRLVPVLTDSEVQSSIRASSQSFTVNAGRFTPVSVSYRQDIP